MKKIALLTLFAAIGFSFMAFKTQQPSGNPFEGVITYSIDVDNAEAAGMFGSSSTLYIKGDKTKTIENGMFAKMIFEDRKKPDSPIILVTVSGGGKYWVKNDTTKTDTATPVIHYVDGTKKIAGYVCNKALITAKEKGQSVTSTVYYTADIITNPSKSGPLKGLKGFPLEYSFSEQGIKITYSATKVKAQSLPDDTFIAHTSGYKLMSEDEIKEDIQQKMQSGN